MTKYFKVAVVAGHQGTKCNKRTLTFYYAAPNALAAMDMAKKMPGVKHSRIPLSCKEVDFEEYAEMIKVSAYKRAGL